MIYYWICHPSKNTRNKELEEGWPLRVSDFIFLLNPELHIYYQKTFKIMTTLTALKMLYRMVQGRRNFCGPSSALLKVPCLSRDS